MDVSGFWIAPYLIFIGALVVLGIGVLSTSKGRGWLVKPENTGPAAYFGMTWLAVIIIYLGLYLFGTYTFEVLGDDGRLIVTSGENLTRGKMSDFYVWHALEFVPFLDVTETIDWQEPVSYSGGAVGFLLLLFKTAIVVPIVLAFRAVRKAHKARATRAAAP